MSSTHTVVKRHVHNGQWHRSLCHTAGSKWWAAVGPTLCKLECCCDAGWLLTECERVLPSYGRLSHGARASRWEPALHQSEKVQPMVRLEAVHETAAAAAQPSCVEHAALMGSSPSDCCPSFCKLGFQTTGVSHQRHQGLGVCQTSMKTKLA